MKKETVRCNMKVQDGKLTLAEYTTYGIMIDKMTIITPEYTFHSHRNTGFGKTKTLHRDVNGRECNISVKIEII